MAKLPVEFDFSADTESPSQFTAPEQDAQLNPEPEHGMFDPQPASAAPVRDRFVRCHLDEEGSLVIDHIPDGFTEEEKELISYWYPSHYMQPSEYVSTPKKMVITAEHALEHAYGSLRKQSKEQKEKRKVDKEEGKRTQSEYAEAYINWINACGQRKEVINAARVEWKKRVEERKKALQGWDNYVAEARNAITVAESVPVPPRPVKPGN